MVLDPSGNVYITGKFSSTVDFDPGVGTFNLVCPLNFQAFILKLDNSGNFIWAKQVGGTGVSQAEAISIDAQGNVYTTGNFTQTAVFDSGSGLYNLTSFDNKDIFIAKLDASGNFIWVKQIGGTDNQYGMSIAIDDFDNVYTAGFYKGTVDFDPGTGVFYLSSSGFYIFISKLDNDGNFAWAKQLEGENTLSGKVIAFDTNNNVYITGNYTATTDFDPGVAVYNLANYGGGNSFILKLNTMGNFIWVKELGGSGIVSSNGIELDIAGNIYTTGYIRDTVDFDPGSGTYNLISPINPHFYISKFDTTGNFVWANNFEGSLFSYGQALALDAYGSIFTIGYFKDTIDFDPSAGTFNLISGAGADIFISKISNTITQIPKELHLTDVTIYPNPSQSVIYFSSFSNIQVFNANGQLIEIRKNVNKIDLTEQPTGIYLILLSDIEGQIILRRKIVKQ
jgi:hypothetical protein